MAESHEVGAMTFPISIASRRIRSTSPQGEPGARGSLHLSIFTRGAAKNNNDISVYIYIYICLFATLVPLNPHCQRVVKMCLQWVVLNLQGFVVMLVMLVMRTGEARSVHERFLGTGW